MFTSLTFYWGLVESHHTGCFFCPKTLRDGRDLWMVLCHSINAGWVVGTLRGGGDTQTIPAVIKFIWTFLTQRQSGHEDIFLRHTCTLVPTRAPMSHLVKLSLLNIYTSWQWPPKFLICMGAFDRALEDETLRFDGKGIYGWSRMLCLIKTIANFSTENCNFGPWLFLDVSLTTQMSSAHLLQSHL